MQVAPPIIWAACFLAIASAAGVILARKPVYAAVALLAHSLVLTGLYLLLAADLVAVAQMLIYSGAIVVLFLFVVALLPSGGSELPSTSGRVAAAVLGSGLLLAALAAALSSGAPTATAQPAGGIVPVARALFGSLLASFELTAPLLLVAIVGGVVIWRRQGDTR